MKQSLQNTNDSFAKSSQEVSQLLETVLERAKKKGVSNAAVSASLDRGFSVEVRMGEVDTLEFNEDKGISVTVFIGQSMGQASSTDTALPAIDSMLQAACDIAKVSAADPCFGLAEPDLMSRHQEDLQLYHPWDLTPAAAIEQALACEQKALAYDKRIVNSDGVALSTHRGCHGYANSHGAFGVTLSTRHSLSCSVLAEKEGKLQRDYDYSLSRYAEQLKTADHIAIEAAERSIARLGARKVKTQKAGVIFSNRVSAGVMKHFISAISGGNLYRKNSFLLDAQGKAVFPDMVHIHEQPYLPGALNSSCYDADGVKTRNNQIVVDGVLEQYVLSHYTARRLGLQTTANAGGVHNLSVEATAGDLASLMQQMGTGLLVTELMGQGVNGLTGDYSRGASGFWVENGVIAFPVEEVTIAGNLKQMFLSIQAIGSDVNPNYSVRCGSLLINDMMIAGD
ncbi:MAG: metalloprotease PmbA [Legionellaceae bacterium]|nr:metalloprotease PmbA [Legionellaceae bacterium]